MNWILEHPYWAGVGGIIAIVGLFLTLEQRGQNLDQVNQQRQLDIVQVKGELNVLNDKIQAIKETIKQDRLELNELENEIRTVSTLAHLFEQHFELNRTQEKLLAWSSSIQKLLDLSLNDSQITQDLFEKAGLDPYGYEPKLIFFATESMLEQERQIKDTLNTKQRLLKAQSALRNEIGTAGVERQNLADKYLYQKRIKHVSESNGTEYFEIVWPTLEEYNSKKESLASLKGRYSDTKKRIEDTERSLNLKQSEAEALVPKLDLLNQQDNS